MTIIEPNKNRLKLNYLLSLLLLGLAGLMVWSIIVYNQTINLRYALGEREDSRKAAEVQNVELKKTRYDLTDIKNLRLVAATGGLVKAQAVEYFKAGQGALLARQ